MDAVPSAGPSIGRKLARNALWNVAGVACQGAVLLFLVAYMVKKLGPERYGLWALLGAVVSYFAIADITSNSTLTKYVAEYHSRGDRAVLQCLIDNGALFYAGLVTGVLALGSLVATPLLHLLNIPSYLAAEARFVYFVVLATFCVETFANVFTSIINGMQRMAVLNGVTITANILRVCGTVVALQGGWGLRGIAVNEVAVESVSLLLMAALAKRIYPPLCINPFHFDAVMLRRIVGFGMKLQVGGMAELVNFQFDKILLSHVLGVQSVAFYDIGVRLVKYARGFLIVVASALTPAVSELHAHDDNERIAALYRTTSKYLVTVGALVLGFFFFMSADIVGLWVGPGYAQSALTMRIISIGYFANVATAIVCHMATGIGKPEYLLRASAIQVLANIVLSVILVFSIGYYGAAIGSTCALTIGALYFIGTFGKEVGDSLRHYLGSVLAAPILAAGLAGGFALFLNTRFWAVTALGPQRLLLAGVLLASLVVYGVLYGLILHGIGYLHRGDWQLLRRNLGGPPVEPLPHNA